MMLPRKETVLLAALLLTLPALGVAQSTEAAGEEAETMSEESGVASPEGEAGDAGDAADGNTLSGLSMGTVDADTAGVGQTYVAETFNDWEMRCVRTESGDDPCQLYQLLRDGEGNSVAEFSLFNLPEGSGQAVGGATVVTPLETLLTAQLRLAVDGGETRRYPYSFCSQIGCFARLGFTQGEIDNFKRGAKATVTLVPAAAPDETVVLDVSLSGFTAGWDAVVEANASR